MGAIDSLVQIGIGFTGGIAAGFIGPHMNQAKDRQAARSTAAERISDVEGSRWSNGTYDLFRQTVGSFRAAAIGARLPKTWVDQYVGLCKVLYGMRRHPRPDNMPEGEYENVLEVLDNRASEYADALVVLLWHPYPAHVYFALFRQSTAKRITRARKFLADDWGYTDPILGKTLRAWDRRFTETESMPTSSQDI